MLVFKENLRLSPYFFKILRTLIIFGFYGKGDVYLPVSRVSSYIFFSSSWHQAHLKKALLHCVLCPMCIFLPLFHQDTFTGSSPWPSSILTAFKELNLAGGRHLVSIFWALACRKGKALQDNVCGTRSSPNML